MLSIDINKVFSLRNAPISSRLEVPIGVEKRQWNVKNSELYLELNKMLSEHGRISLGRESSYCFYCGSKTNNITPAFLHNGSGHNLWMYEDSSSSYIICLDCMKYYGDNKVNYFGPMQDIGRGRQKTLLSFLPEIVLPTIELSHLHFNYDSSGYLEPRSERAKRTIQRFSLNRRDLIARRSESIDLFETYGQLDRINVPNDILFSLSALQKRYRKEEIISFINTKSAAYKNPFEVKMSSQLRKEINARPDMTYQLKRKQFSGIDKIEFSGVRDFKDVQEIKFNGKGNIIILGENGVGKSTLLEILKRTLKKGARKNLSDLCHDSNNLPMCAVTYSNQRYSLRYDGKGKFLGIKDECNVVYISDSRTSPRFVHDLAKWIQNNSYEDELVHWIARRLSSLLALPGDFYFCTNEDGVYWQTQTTPSGRFYLTDFSSGYNSILTIFYKVLSGVAGNSTGNTFNSLLSELSSTIVLIDEVELHLHPKFKKNIIRNLSETFPEVIFVVTTHDPLTLKSTSEGDLVITIEKNNGYASINTDLPNHRNLTSEQILSSPIFGLSTIEDVERINEINISNYYNAIKEKNWNKVSEMRDILSHSGFFGKTYRELVALSAVDAYLSRGKKPDLESVINLLSEIDHNEKN